MNKIVSTVSLLFACAISGSSNGAPAAPATVPVLLELFTSEGCSSCPPADRWVQELDATQPVPGAQLIVLSEHVDYWNHDGWKDRFSSSAATDRQSAYCRVLKLPEVYTPQVIVDGTAVLTLSNPQQTRDILLKAVATQTLPVSISAVRVDDSKSPALGAHIETGEYSENRNADIYVAVALDHVDSDVSRGENQGRHLSHVSVVESLKKIGNVETGKNFSRDFEMKLKPGTDPSNIRVIAFVQESGTGRVLGAALRKPPFQ